MIRYGFYNKEKFDLDRFNNKISYPENTDCWIWTGAKSSGGYGHFGVHTKIVIASRISWELVNGPIPKDKWVLHTCDNRACVNPNHLFLGDRSDNAKDMFAKGRGFNSGRVIKFYQGELDLIRKIHESRKFSYIFIGKMFKVHRKIISDIIKYPLNDKRRLNQHPYAI
jgi:hypothetical protein